MANDFTFHITTTRFDEDYTPSADSRITTNFANLARGEHRRENLRNALTMIDRRFNDLAHWDNPTRDRYTLELDIISAALEFAVTQLEVPEVVVMGHASCGGCAAALSGGFKDSKPGEGGFISDWVGLLDGARDKVKAKFGDGPDAKRELEHEAVRVSIENLRTFPFVTEREAAGTLKLRGAYFAIADGQLHVMDDDGVFAAA